MLIIVCLISASANFVYAEQSQKQQQLNEQLIEASENGNLKKVNKLLKAGADVNSKYVDDFNHSTSVLVLAAQKGYTEIVQLLLEKGAKDKDEAFKKAVWARKWEAATLLRDAGANTVIPNDCTGPEEFVIPSIQQQKSEELLSFIIHTETIDEAAEAKIKQLVAEGADIDYTKGDDAVGDCACNEEPPDSPLIVAIRHEDLRLVNLLLELGADVNTVAISDCGDFKIYETAWSAALGNKEITNLLVRHMEKNKNAENLAAMLRAGVAGESEDIVKLALEWGANVNARYDAFNSVLTRAISSENTGIVKLLLANGADVNAVVIGKYPGYDRENYKTAWSAASGNKEITNLLVRHMEKNKNAKSLADMLRAGVLGGSEDAVKLALEWGADANAKDIFRDTEHANYGTTALMYSAEEAHVEIVELLLKAGADINAKDNAESTALIQVADVWNFGVVKHLIDAGADVNAKNWLGDTALIRAVFFNRTMNVEWLLEAGADVNAKNEDGKTALMYAKENGNEKIVSLLKSYGAKEHVEDEEDEE